MACFPTDFPTKKKTSSQLEQTIKFIGRQKYLNEIKDFFQSNQTIALCSYGGVGKTTLALEYCNKLTLDDPDAYIRWFNSDTSENLNVEYKLFASLLKVNTNNGDMDYIIQETNMKLRGLNKNILFVFDSLSNFKNIENYISCIPNRVKVLITTRDQLKQSDFPKINLLPFDLNEANDYIEKNFAGSLSIDQKEKILSLVKTSQNDILPIKIEIIISYLNYNYLDDIDDSIQKIIHNNYHNKQVEYTLFFYFEINDDLNTKNAFEMLQYLSFLNSNFIPIEIYRAIFKNNLNDSIDIYQCSEIIRKLSLVSMVTKNNKKGVSMHNLIQDEIKKYAANNEVYFRIKNNKEIHKNIVKTLNQIFKYVDEDPKSWIENEQYYLQALSLINGDNCTYIEENKEIIDLIEKIYHYEYYSDNNHTHLLDRAFKLYEMGRRVYGDVHSFIAKSLTGIAIGFEKKSDFQKALEYYLEAHEMNLKFYGKIDHPEIAKSLNNLGIGYFLVKDFQKSLDSYKQALSMREKFNESKLIAESLNNVGVGYDKINDFNTALEYKRKALEIYERIYSNTDHSDLATALNNVGTGYDRIDNLEKALEYKKKGFEMRKNLYKNIHSDIAESLQSLAKTYFRMDKFENALEYFIKEYEMYLELHKNDETSEKAESLKNIGDCFEKMGEFRKSLSNREQSLEMYTKIHRNRDHLDVADSLEKVGIAHEKLNELDLSSTFKLKATEMKQRLNSGN